VLKVALDFDCVLADTITVWVQIYNKKYGRSIKRSDIIEWNLCKLLGISEDAMWEIFHLCWTEWENLPPMEDNICVGVEQIRKMSLTDVVTSAKFSYIESIRLWLDSIGIKSINIFSKSEKAGLDYDIFIDDNPSTALSVSECGKICLLYDQPWNKKVHSNNIIRINYLSDAVSYINKSITRRL